jgi:hypothetical protein
LYQPQFDPDAEYCDQIPRAGNTVLVVDVLGDDLRRLPIGVRVFSSEAPGRSILSLPPAIYRRGVADGQVILDSGGAHLTVTSGVDPSAVAGSAYGDDGAEGALGIDH